MSNPKKGTTPKKSSKTPKRGVKKMYAALKQQSIQPIAVSPEQKAGQSVAKACGVAVKREHNSFTNRSVDGYAIYVAVIVGHAYLFWLEHSKVSQTLSNLVWKLNNEYKKDTILPEEVPALEMLDANGFINRTFKLVNGTTTTDGKYFEKQELNVRKKPVAVFQITLSDDSPAATKEQMFRFFSQLGEHVLDRLPGCSGIKSRPHWETFLKMEDATYEEIIGRNAAKIRFKYEVGENDKFNPDPDWFEKNRCMLMKYFRPGRWWAELAAEHDAPNPKELLTTTDWNRLKSKGLVESSDEEEEEEEEEKGKESDRGAGSDVEHNMSNDHEDGMIDDDDDDDDDDNNESDNNRGDDQHQEDEDQNGAEEMTNASRSLDFDGQNSI